MLKPRRELLLLTVEESRACAIQHAFLRELGNGRRIARRLRPYVSARVAEAAVAPDDGGSVDGWPLGGAVFVDEAGGEGERGGGGDEGEEDER